MNKAAVLKIKRYRGDPCWFIFGQDGNAVCKHSQPTLDAALDWAKTNYPEALTAFDEKDCIQSLAGTTFKCTLIVLAILAVISFIGGILYQGING